MTAFNKNAWYRQLVKSVSPRAFAVGFVLIENFHFRGKEECWSSQETLGRLANASPRTVRDALKELDEAGFLTHRRGGKGHANRYIPHFVDRQDFAGQNGSESVDDRQDSACDDRQDSAADIAEQQLKSGAPLARGSADTSAIASDVREEGPTSSPPRVAMGDVGDDIAPIDARMDSLSSVDPDPTTEADWSDDEEDAEPTYDEKLEELRDLVADLVRYRIHLPEALEDFLEADSDPEEHELETLLDLANGVFDEENARVDAHNAEIDAARASVAARQATVPLSERINDSAARSAYVGKLSTYLATLPREQRLSIARTHSAKIVAGLVATLPRHLAEAQAHALSDEVLTEVWRRDRAREAQAVEASTNVVSLAIMRTKKEQADG